MSLRTKHRKYPGLASSGGFSSLSLGAYSIPRVSSADGVPIKAVTINKSLLTPLKVDIDRTVQAVRTQEKEQIKTLNNRFASVIEKVQKLEQQNKMLETEWNLLQKRAVDPIQPMLETYITNLQRQLQHLNRDHERLRLERGGTYKSVEVYKTKYEEEVNGRVDAENKFVMVKKDLDASCMAKVDLENKLSALNKEAAFLKALYDEELRELQDFLKDTSVVVQMDNSRSINMDQITTHVRTQYEEFVGHKRTETETWYKMKLNQMSTEASQHNSELRTLKEEIAELKQKISCLQHDTDIATTDRTSFENQIAEVERHGDQTVLDAKNRIKDLEQALQTTKHDVVLRIKEYQELLHAKLALDIEISTYKKMLEGEEERLGQQHVTNIQAVPTRAAVVPTHQWQGPIFVKLVETQHTSYS